MKEILDGELLLARFGNVDEIQQGWQFYNEDDEPLQYGVGLFNKDTEMPAHTHIPRERIRKHKTSEFILVLGGKIRVTIFKNNMTPAHNASFVLKSRDWVAFHDGGHKVEVLHDFTKLLEVKNGPFVSVSEDKIKTPIGIVGVFESV